MTPYQRKLFALVQNLAGKTSKGEVKWTLDDGVVSAQLKSGVVNVRRAYDDDGQDAIILTVADENGDVKLSFDDNALAYKLQPSGHWMHYYAEMNDLYVSAVRSATGEEQVLNDLLSELEDDDDLPF